MNNNLANDILLQMQEQQTKNAETLGQIQATLEGLAGQDGRITKLERNASRQWWLTMAVTPFMTVLYAIAKKIGAIA